MASQFHNLDRESLLMLYAADELSAPDRQRVETMLATDARLRVQLEELTATQAVVSAAFLQADAKAPLPAPVSSSVRQVGSAMRQWQVDRLTKPTQANPRQGRKLGWVYASAAVAAGIIITVFVLWSRVDDGKQPMVKLWDDTPAKQDDATAKQDDTAQIAPEAPQPEQVAQEDPDDYTPTGVGDADRQLSSAEHEMTALSTLSDSLRPAEETVTP